MADAVCDVMYMNLHVGCPLHVNGDLLTFSYQHGYKQREPGLAAVDLSVNPTSWDDESYSHGFYAESISHVSGRSWRQAVYGLHIDIADVSLGLR